MRGCRSWAWCAPSGAWPPSSRACASASWCAHFLPPRPAQPSPALPWPALLSCTACLAGMRAARAAHALAGDPPRVACRPAPPRLQPFAEVLGSELPTKVHLSVVLIVCFFLGVLVTYAEPAIASLRPLASLVSVPLPLPPAAAATTAPASQPAAPWRRHLPAGPPSPPRPQPQGPGLAPPPGTRQRPGIGTAIRQDRTHACVHRAEPALHLSIAAGGSLRGTLSLLYDESAAGGRWLRRRGEALWAALCI